MPDEVTETPLATEWCRRNGKSPHHMLVTGCMDHYEWRGLPQSLVGAAYNGPAVRFHKTPLAAMIALDKALADCRAACGADDAVREAVRLEREACAYAAQNVTLKYIGQPVHDACADAIRQRGAGDHA